MQSPQPLISKPVKWRLWHAFTSFVGGATFLTASFLLFHTLDLAVDTEDISAALFVVGSLAFLAATIMESLHYHHSDYRYLS